jgi:hypothetical protein
MGRTGGTVILKRDRTWQKKPGKNGEYTEGFFGWMTIMTAMHPTVHRIGQGQKQQGIYVPLTNL